MSYFEPLSAAAEVAADFDDTFNFVEPHDDDHSMADVLAKLSSEADGKKRKYSDTGLSPAVAVRIPIFSL